MKKFRQVRPRSINFVFWLVLSCFIGVITIVVGVLQVSTMSRTVRTEVASNLSSTSYSVVSYFDGSIKQEEEVSSYLLNMSASSGFGIFILDGNGLSVYPRVWGSEEYLKDYSAELAQGLKKYEELSDQDSYGVIYLADSSHYAFLSPLIVNGESHYIYISASFEMENKVIASLQIRILFFTILILVIAFLVSGVISLRFSRPISDLSQKSRRLAKGDYSVDFADEYYYYSEIDELARTLNYARDEISKSDAMQKELIANVSHDMKTPLTMIKAYASMIQEISGDDPVKRKKHTQVIIDESDRLTSLVNDILDLSKIRAGLDELKLSVFNLSEFLYGVIGRFGYLAETQGYTFITDIAENLYTAADKAKIGQVLYNLIGNAVNYTGDDKVIRISLKEEGGVIVFRVKDTGKGIAPEELATIWDRYYRSQETHKRPVQGTGLGLSIVKTICEKHGFVYRVESTVGEGSSFLVEFPLTNAELKEQV